MIGNGKQKWSCWICEEWAIDFHIIFTCYFFEIVNGFAYDGILRINNWTGFQVLPSQQIQQTNRKRAKMKRHQLGWVLNWSRMMHSKKKRQKPKFDVNWIWKMKKSANRLWARSIHTIRGYSMHWHSHIMSHLQRHRIDIQLQKRDGSTQIEQFYNSDWVNNLWFTTEQMFRTFYWHEKFRRLSLKRANKSTHESHKTARKKKKGRKLKTFYFERCCKKNTSIANNLHLHVSRFICKRNSRHTVRFALSICSNRKYWLWLVCRNEK